MPKITVTKVFPPAQVGWKESYICERPDGATAFFSLADVGKVARKEGESFDVSETTLATCMKKIDGTLKPAIREWKAKEGAVIPPKADPLRNVAINGVVSSTPIERVLAQTKAESKAEIRPTVQYWNKSLDELRILVASEPVGVIKGHIENILVERENTRWILEQLQVMNKHFHKLEALLGTIDHGLETVLPLFDTKLERILGAIEKGAAK